MSEDEKGYTNAYRLQGSGYSLDTYMSAIAYEKPFLITICADSQPLAMLDIKQKRTWPPRFQIVGGATARDLYVLATIRAKPPRGSKDPDKETLYSSLAYVPLKGSRQRAQPPLSSTPGEYRIMATRSSGEGAAEFLLANLSPPRIKFREASAVELQSWTISDGRAARTKKNAFGAFDGLRLPATAEAVYPKTLHEGGRELQPSLQAFDPIGRHAYYHSFRESRFPGAEYDLRTRSWKLLARPPEVLGFQQPVYGAFYQDGKLYLSASDFRESWDAAGKLFVTSQDRRSWRRLGPYRVFARSPSGKYWVVSGGEGKGLWLLGLK